MAHADMLRSISAGPSLETIAPPGFPGRGDVLVAMRLAPINPSDLLALDG